ncbi:bifunctional cytidylyltransferase/SDR family oxidoreductase [Nonomuraea sp. SMC257]|uniref:2-C-methyl-D-erythritol 4-phosphate cytidylyltransferase n=1 Tax=Nonomuraea montanisoli TaxID=2741721 RepID=A0A7Y6I1T1_9ACTN|nr:bifunctional cytidylyltransferase/SDR family oxidoreductase [Nonomuraea montanisoli]NUW30150.1 bifunctional cytidylyltransferase/SDR family oxidoreductase [Nonomuraea montanisoli]
MDSGLRAVGVVLAGGVGQRMGLGRPKQLATVAGRTILEHSIALFDGSPDIDEVVVLMTPGLVDEARELVARAGFRKVTKVVEGGASRTESTWRALRAIGEDECDVLLHDAVRPLLEPRIITDCVRALRDHRAVEVAIPSSDTIFAVEPGPGGETITEVLDRSLLRRAQTPQCFRLSVIREAYERALADPGFADRPATDDCGVVLRYLPDVPIHIVPGSERNLKITHPVDARIAAALFEASPVPALPEEDALAGRTVVLLDAGGAGVREAAELASRHGARAVVLSCERDGLRLDDPRSLAKALAGVGRIDHLVLAVAAGGAGGLMEAADESVAEAAVSGYLGPVNVARAAYPRLMESGGGLLLCVPAGAEDPLGAPAEAAVTALARSLAAAWAGEGVRVNCVTGGGTAEETAGAWLAVLASRLTGQVVDASSAR